MQAAQGQVVLKDARLFRSRSENARHARGCFCRVCVKFMGRAYQKLAGSPRFPEFFPSSAELAAPERNDGVGTGDSPAHSGLLEPKPHDCLAASFNNTRTDEQTLSAELGVAHAILVDLEIGDGFADFLPSLQGLRSQALHGGDYGFHIAGIELRFTSRCPFAGLFTGRPVESFSQIRQVLTGMIQIYNLNGGGKVLCDDAPDPRSSVSHHNHLLSLTEPPPDRFGINAWAKVLSRLDSTDIGGGSLVANGIASGILPGLSEDTAELGFAGLGLAVGVFAPAPFGFAGDHGYAGAIHGDVEFGHRRHQRFDFTR